MQVLKKKNSDITFVESIRFHLSIILLIPRDNIGSCIKIKYLSNVMK